MIGHRGKRLRHVELHWIGNTQGAAIFTHISVVNTQGAISVAAKEIHSILSSGYSHHARSRGTRFTHGDFMAHTSNRSIDHAWKVRQRQLCGRMPAHRVDHEELALRRQQRRVAILLSGHVRDSCSGGVWALQQTLARCRTAFSPARCDVFLHTWERRDSGDASDSSWSCVTQLESALSPVAVTVQRQEHVDLNMTRQWRNSRLSYEGYRLNVAGMVAAADLMVQHALQHRLRYDVALRLRTDVGSARILRLLNGTLSADGWSAIHRAALTPTSVRELRSCSHVKRPGAAGADNCFWSAPSEPLVDTLHALRDRFDSLSRATTPKGCLHSAHPESLLRCAARAAGVVARPLIGE